MITLSSLEATLIEECSKPQDSNKLFVTGSIAAPIIISEGKNKTIDIHEGKKLRLLRSLKLKASFFEFGLEIKPDIIVLGTQDGFL
jgi:hypothetical protein